MYHAISVLPNRPEAYYLLSKTMEIDEPFQCYSYCTICISHKDNARRVTKLPFEYDYYRLLFHPHLILVPNVLLREDNEKVQD